MSIKQQILKSDTFYHIYNHAVGNDKLFFMERNYSYFLSKYDEYISPIANTYCYCLMPNHFHFLIQLKSEKIIYTFLKEINRIPETVISFEEFKELSSPDEDVDYLNLHLIKLFSSLFNGYAQAVNIQEKRKGNLFIKGFRRKEITSSEYLKDLILYIHLNPVHHQFADKLETWKHNSYNSILSDKPTKLKRNEMFNLFEGKENFVFSHNQKNEEVIQRMESIMNE